MSYADIVLAMVFAAPPTRKNRRATSWPAPISANVPYLLTSKLIWRAFLSVPTSISGFIQLLWRRSPIVANLATGLRPVYASYDETATAALARRSSPESSPGDCLGVL